MTEARRDPRYIEARTRYEADLAPDEESALIRRIRAAIDMHDIENEYVRDAERTLDPNADREVA